jgi:hypothetical protein
MCISHKLLGAVLFRIINTTSVLSYLFDDFWFTENEFSVDWDRLKFSGDFEV